MAGRAMVVAAVEQAVLREPPGTGGEVAIEQDVAFDVVQAKVAVPPPGAERGAAVKVLMCADPRTVVVAVAVATPPEPVAVRVKV